MRLTDPPCSSTRATFSAYALIALLAIASMWPLPLRITSVIPVPDSISIGSPVRGDGDPFMFCWNFYWIRGWIEGRHALYQCADLHHPTGVSLAHHTLALTSGLLAVPLTHLMSIVAAYNLLLILQVMLTGIAACLALRSLNLPVSVGVCGAITAMLWPARQIRDLVHPNLSGTGFLWLAILFTIRFIRAPSVGTFIALSLSAVAAAGQDPHHALFLLLLLPGIIGSAGVRGKRLAMALTAGVILLAAIGAALPALIAADRFAPRSIDEKERFSVHLMSLVTPPAHTLPGRLGFTPEPAPDATIESTAYLGIPILIILLAGRVWKRRDARVWLLTALVCIVIALGPTLRIAEWSIPMPYRWLGSLPGLDIARAPGRFMIPAGFALVFALAVLLSGTGRSSRGATAAAILVLLDFFPAPLPTQPAATPPIYDTFAPPDPSRPAVIDVPGDPAIRVYQYYQTRHRRPISTGFVSRIPPSVFHTRDGIPLLTRLSDRETAASAFLRASPVDIADLLALLDASTVVIHRNHLTRPLTVRPEVLGVLWQAGRVHEDGDRIVLDYPLPPEPKAPEHHHGHEESGECVEHQAPPRWYFREGWHPVENWSAEREGVRWMDGGTAVIRVFLSAEARTARIGADLFPPPMDRPAKVVIGMRPGDRSLAAIDLDPLARWQHHQWTIDGPFPSGELVLTITASPVSRPSDRREGAGRHDARMLGPALSAFSVEVF